MKTQIIELSGKVSGIIGFGKIGQHIAKIAKAFWIKVIYYDRLDKGTNKNALNMGELLNRCDFISFHYTAL